MYRPSRAFRTFFLATTSLLFASCQAELRREESPGRLPDAAPSSWTIDTTPLLDISGVSGGRTTLQNPGGGTRLSDGSLLIADLGSTSVKLIDTTGVLLKTFGREGSGPGEYQILLAASRCGTDSLFVSAREDAVILGPGGEARRFPLPVDSLRPLKSFACKADGTIAYLTQPFGRSSLPNGMLQLIGAAVIMDRRGRVLEVVDSISAGEWMPVERGAFPRPLGPTTYLAAVGDRIAIGVSDSARVWVLDPKGRLSVLTIPFTPRRPTATELDDAISAVAEMAPVPRRAAVRAQLANAPAPGTVPPYFGLFGDPTGLLWVQQSVPGSPRTEFVVIDHDGRVVARPVIPMEFTMYEVGRDYILGTYADANDEVHLVVLRLRRR